MARWARTGRASGTSRLGVTLNRPKSTDTLIPVSFYRSYSTTNDDRHCLLSNPINFRPLHFPIEEN